MFGASGVMEILHKSLDIMRFARSIDKQQTTSKPTSGVGWRTMQHSKDGYKKVFWKERQESRKKRE